MSAKLQRLQADIADHLEEICKLFTQRPKVTIVLRTPWLAGEGDVVLTDDDTALAIAAIKKLEASKTATITPPTGVCP